MITLVSLLLLVFVGLDLEANSSMTFFDCATVVIIPLHPNSKRPIRITQLGSDRSPLILMRAPFNVVWNFCATLDMMMLLRRGDAVEAGTSSVPAIRTTQKSWNKKWGKSQICNMILPGTWSRSWRCPGSKANECWPSNFFKRYCLILGPNSLFLTHIHFHFCLCLARSELDNVHL